MEQHADDLDLRTSVGYLSSEVHDMRQEFRADIRRLDDRVFQLMLLQLGTLATALVSIAVTLLR